MQYLDDLKKESEAKQDARFRKGSSRHRGVSWYTAGGKWRMQASLRGGRRFEKFFDNEDDAGGAEAQRACTRRTEAATCSSNQAHPAHMLCAARRYDRIQIELHGRHACRHKCCIIDAPSAPLQQLSPADRARSYLQPTSACMQRRTHQLPLGWLRL